MLSQTKPEKQVVISYQTGKNKLLSINNHAPLIWLVEEKYE